jgi:hypothetical protein
MQARLVALYFDPGRDGDFDTQLGALKSLLADLAVESDHHKDNRDEDKLVAQSVAYLKKLVAEI